MFRRSSQEKFQARISDLMKTKAADAEKQAAAVTEAVEKAKADISNSSDPAAQEALQKRHAEELRSLEEKLTLKHETELKTQIESAVAEALKAKPTTSTDVDQKAAIDAAIAKYDEQVQARHAEDIASAVDRGRMEQAAKGKLKDSQLVKAQKRVKELEALIHECEVQGIKLPTIAPTPTTAVAPSTTTAVVVPAPSAAASVQTTAASTSGAGPSETKPTPTAPAATNAGTLPRRPGVTPPTGPAVGLGRGSAVRGGGRGVPLGVARGGLRTAPVKSTAPSPIPVAPAGGVSIMGAAAKRPREEVTSSEDHSLAKRIKAAESTNKPAQTR